jgi:hypothetical protein
MGWLAKIGLHEAFSVIASFIKGGGERLQAV